jgi:transposase
VNTIQTQPSADGPQRRRRRTRSDEFKASAVASCMQPGMSMAAVAMAHWVNANLLRRWVQEAELHPGARKPDALTAPKAAPSPPAAAFVPMQLPAKSAACDIRIELRRGTTSINVSWPSDATAECAAWMRELLR